ncbi:MAG: alpha-glucan family phosphorylase [candidate division Zixibacteria bacterium]|nr:alpha-glucan family phosphorylase [Candidatus Tariuqbacter arcticus]
MKLVGTFNVTPKLPEPLKPLYTLAYNFYWCWNYDVIELFRWLDRELWETVKHNPILLLGTIDQSKIEEASTDDGFIARLDRVSAKFNEYISSSAWFGKTHGDRPKGSIAYFSAEYGITESLPIYSGGLGILAGDHLKSASDLGLPLVGVGLLYQEGYFRQYLNADGWQQEWYPRNDFYNLPLTPEKATDDRWLKVELDFPGRKVYARILRADVGRIPLYLLDVNLPENSPEDRTITNQLYGGDIENRIKQEILLGIGGIRALKLLGIIPQVCHMNEGHSGFLALERIRLLIENEGLSFEEAREVVRSGSIFTTHTPVSAGIDEFPPEMMNKYFKQFFPDLKISWKQFLSLGRFNPGNDSGPFNMAMLSLNMALYANGVSKLHGEVSRKMWSNYWPGASIQEVPITSVTNGIHHRSWISHDIKELFDRYLSPRWRSHPGDLTVWEGTDSIPADELWKTHERRRERLVAYARRKLVAQYRRRGLHTSEIEIASEVLDPSILTIGFARRFAAYKRATLILHDKARLKRILNHPEMPVQIIFAGKAHPRDNIGKGLIRELAHTMREEDFRYRMVFLEDYDIEVARYLVQGVDVWLNNPRRLKEASGTSGMKVLPNGGLNLSIPDGWWDEVECPEAGWTIGSGEEYESEAVQDEIESNALYDLLEREIAPLFYNRGRDRIPRQWVEKMRLSIKKLSAEFNTNRMVKEYAEMMYLSAMNNFSEISGDDYARAKVLASWKNKMYEPWDKIKVENFRIDLPREVKVGDLVNIEASVNLGELKPEDVTVQIYYGPVNDNRVITEGKIAVLTACEGKEGSYQYQGEIPCRRSGRQGYGLRILPHHQNLLDPLEMGLIYWYDEMNE